jgi:hypothetical protein
MHRGIKIESDFKMPFDWDQPLNGVGCKLSPFGVYDTVEGCRDESHCNARWRCAARDGETDVFGVEVAGGNPLLATDGVYNTREECMCYECDPSGGGCVPTDKRNGTHQEASCGDACVYGYKANPANNNTCELSLDEDAVGVSEEECQIVQFGLHPGENAHGGGYGCFNQFACRYGVCVGIPESGDGSARPGEPVYESMAACTEAGCDADTPTVPEPCDPLPGSWRVHRGNSGIYMFGDESDQLFTFSASDLDADGFQWYNSSVSGDDSPILRLGFREDINNGERTVLLKMLGRLQITAGSGDFKYMWSINSEGGTPEAPAANVVATLPDDGSCFEMTSLDLNKFCGESACLHRSTTTDTTVGSMIILQREDLCGDDVWVGNSSPDGTLNPELCP